MLMVKYFRSEDGKIRERTEPEAGGWIALTNPTAAEILEVSARYEIDIDDLKAPLDEEERSRIETEDHYTLILVDIPIIEERNEKDWYGTIPMGIIMREDIMITVCLMETPILTAFMEGRVRGFNTYWKTRFILQILYKNASWYLHYLRIIDKKSEEVETRMVLPASPRNTIMPAFTPMTRSTLVLPELPLPSFLISTLCFLL